MLERKPEPGVVGRVLRLGVDADLSVELLRPALRQRDDLFERGDLEAAVELLRPLGQRLDGAQRLDLGEGEVGREEAGLGYPVDHLRRFPVGELGMAAHVGRAGDVRLVAGDQVPVLRGHQVRLDVVGAELDRQLVPLQRVVGQVAGSAAVPDHERRLLAAAAAAERPHDRHCEEQHPHSHER